MNVRILRVGEDSIENGEFLIENFYTFSIFYSLNKNGTEKQSLYRMRRIESLIYKVGKPAKQKKDTSFDDVIKQLLEKTR